MASLRFIMGDDVVDDLPDSRNLHKKQDPAASSHSSQGPAHPPPVQLPAVVNTLGPSHVSSPGDTFDQRISSPAVPAAQRQRRGGPSPRGSLSSALSSTSTLSRDPTARRRSTTSNDSMDQGGYGSAASSSSLGGGLNIPSNGPMRPMVNQTGSDMPIKYTPITGRVSRAKKGVPVHTCEICKPPKTFTRAEHLRRHQLSHQTPGFPCRYPGCDRAFHRPDLLTRHQQRHEQEGDKARGAGGDENRRTSLGSSSQSHMSADDSYGSASVLQGQSTGATPSSSAVQDLPSTPNPSANQPSPYGQLGTSPSAHQMGGGGGGFRSPAAGSQDYPGYTLSPRAPTVSVIHPRGPSSMPGPGFPGVLDTYQQPRTTPPSIFVVTQGLSRPSPQIPDNAPDLYHHENSPYVSSASDSTYSTPASEISRGPRFQWVQSRPSPQPDWPPQLLSPYPSATSRELSGSGDVMATTASAPLFVNPFSPSPHFNTSQPHSFGTMMDVSMTGYPSADAHHHMINPASETAYRSHSGHHGNAATSVRSPTPPPNTSSHTTDILVTPTPALPSRLDSMAGLGRHKEMAVEIAGEHHGLVRMDALTSLGGTPFSSPDMSGDGSGSLVVLDLPMGGCGAPIPAAAASLPRSVRAAIPGYLEVYWAQVHRLLPIVHKPSFEADHDDVLRCAMAAVATQYLGSKDDRNRGTQLHEFAWQEAKRIPQWSLQIMQAILLCEYFARFRGRKAVTRPSKLFESLYSRVLYHNPAMFDPAVLNPDQHGAAEERWQAWLDAEARRRLLTACFVVDIHTSVLQQQRRAHECSLSGNGATPPPIPLTGRSTELWEAASAEQWSALLEADPSAGNPTFVPQAEMLAPEDRETYTSFDCSAILACETLRLPVILPPSEFDLHAQHPGDPFAANQQQMDDALSLEAEERISALFGGCATSNTYLAMHHTPLHDLLAVSGDSWVFSQKVLPANSFLEHKKRLKMWVEQQHMQALEGNSLGGMNATKATIYAARAILHFLCRFQTSTPGETTDQSGPGMTDWGYDISDYWGLYVCALICWAFVHRARAGGNRSSASSSGSEGHPNRGSTSAPSNADDESIAWLRIVADMRLEDAPRVRVRREAAGVVGLVRRRLEADCVGGRSRLYVDAVGVLKKLEEGANWKWF